MKTQEWLKKVKDNETVLEALVSRYNPNSKFYSPAKLPITAPDSECVRQDALVEIEAEAAKKLHGNVPVFAYNPVDVLRSSNSESIYDVLSTTWFGVPESTSCWSIPGFDLMVQLLDDPPELDEAAS